MQVLFETPKCLVVTGVLPSLMDYVSDDITFLNTDRHPHRIKGYQTHNIKPTSTKFSYRVNFPSPVNTLSYNQSVRGSTLILKIQKFKRRVLGSVVFQQLKK